MRGSEVDQLYFTLAANMAPLSGSLAQAQTMLGGLTKAIKTPTGAFVTLGAVAAIAGVKATKMAAEFDKAMRELSTLLPTTVEQMGELRQQIIALSTEVPQAPAQLTQGMYEVVSAGITDTKAAFDVLTVASKAASAGLTETTTVVNALTAVLNSYGMGADQATRVSDVLFQTVNEGVIRFSELASNIGDVANTAALSGQSIEVIGAAIATMTQRGITGAEAVTSLNRLILALIDTESAGAEYARGLGVEFGIQALEAEGLAGMMAKLQEATGGNVEELQKVLPEIRAFKAASVLAGTGADQFTESIIRMQRAVGTTEIAFQKNTGALGDQWQLLKNKVNVAWYGFGSVTLPLVAFWLRGINTLLGGLPDEVPVIEGLGDMTDPELQRRINDTQAKIRDLTATLRDMGQVSSWEKPLTAGGQWRPRVIEETTAALRALRQEEQLLQDASTRRAVLSFETMGPNLPPKGTSDFTDALDGLEKKLLKIRDVSADVWDVDAYLAGVRDLAGGMEAAAEAGERLIMTQSSLAGAEADVQALVDAWAALPRSAEGSQVALEAVRRRLAQIGITVDDLTSDELKRLIGMMGQTAGLGAPMESSLEDVAQSVIHLSRTLIDAGHAFGLFGSSGATALNSLANVAQGVVGLFGPDIDLASKIQGITGIVAGVLSIGKSIFSGGESSRVAAEQQAEAARLHSEQMERLRANTEAIERLTHTYAEQLTGIRMGQAVRGAGAIDTGLTNFWRMVEEALAKAQAEGTQAGEFTFTNQWLIDELEKVGLTLDQLRELAKAFGWELEETAEGWAAFAQAMKDADLKRAFETFAGKLNLMQREFDMFDVTDPMAKIKAIFGLLDEFTDLDTTGVDVTNRASLQAWVEAMFKGLPGMGALFGGMTADEIMDLLGQIETLLDTEGGGGAGTTQSYQVSRSITEVTGNRMAGILTTVAYWNERTALGVEAMLKAITNPLQAPSQSEWARFSRASAAGTDTSADGPNVVSVTWTGDIVVTASADPHATAQAVSTRFVDEIDRALGNRMLEVRRARGLALPNGLRS